MVAAPISLDCPNPQIPTMSAVILGIGGLKGMTNESDGLDGIAKRAEKMTDPKGLVGIYTDADGRVIASVSDFDDSGYGGFSLQEAQRFRCKTKLARAVMQAYCSDRVLAVFETYDCEQILNKMVRNGGRATYLPVGWEPDK
jgi:hypothetical protein